MVAVQVRQSRRESIDWLLRARDDVMYNQPTLLHLATLCWQHDEKCNQIKMYGEILCWSVGGCTLNKAIYFRKVSLCDSKTASNILTQVVSCNSRFEVFLHLFFTMSFTTRHTALYKTTPPLLPHLLNCKDTRTEHRLNLSSISAL